MSKFSERIKIYEDNCDYKLMSQVPIIVKARIVSYTKFIKNIEKPFCEPLAEISSNAMFDTVKEIEGALLAYHFGEEFIFILRNDLVEDSSAFYSNKVQKISSRVSSLLTNAFLKHFFAADVQPDVAGEAIFDAHTFSVPKVSEAANLIFMKQKDCMASAVSAILEFELLKANNKKDVLDMIKNKSISERISLLKDMDIQIENYPWGFLYGYGSYKSPKILTISNEQISKNKWTLDNKFPNLQSDRNFILNIIKSGHDVFRVD